MTPPVLVAAELKNLLTPDQVAGLDVRWLAGSQATPRGNYVALVPLLTRWVGGTELKALPKLKIVANCAAGYDNIDLVAAELRGVAVSNTPDVLTEATADLTWALILACARRLPEGIDLVRSGHWAGWHPEQLLGLELNGRTMGVLGAGRIGQAVGRRAVAFGMRVVYRSRQAKPDFEHECNAVAVTWDVLLETSDVLSLHAPATPETRGVMDAVALSRMKRGAILINTARGDLVREDALAAALETGHLGAAGLDVYANEPNISDRLRAAPRTVLLPHLGSATTETRRRMASIALANVRAVLAGRAPLTPVYR